MALKNDTIAVSASGGKTLATKRQSRVTNENSNNLALALEAQLGKGGLTEVTEMTFRKPAVRA